jgi:hypothetical protein
MMRVLLVGMAVLASVHVGVLAYHLGAIVVFPYDLEYGEGYVLNDAVRLSQGEQNYVDLTQFPMVRSPYPPLFPLVWSALVPLTGAGFWPGRLLSITALLGLALVVGWNAWRACRSPWPVVAAVGILVASPFVYQWAGYARVDLLALLFAVGGVVVAQWVRGWSGVIGAALLCGLAIWTKQTTLTAAVAVAIALVLRDWRLALGFVALITAPTVTLIAALNANSNGEFARHVLLGNSSNPFFQERALFYVGTFMGLHVALVVGVVWWVRRALNGLASPIALYVPISLLAAVSSGNAGSSVNYLLEPLIALCLGLPFAWRALPSAAVVVGPLLACVQLVVLLHWPNGLGTGWLADFGLGHTPTSADFAAGARLDSIVRAESGALIAEPAGFALRNGRGVYLQPIDLRAEELQGRWRSDDLVSAVREGRFQLLITSYNFFPFDVERALAAHFELVESHPGPGDLTYRVYRYTLRVTS